uniref:Uncharacterized protein n=1 Tax=Rhizophagus irregularis (strain DAOM 181602 / DAOM 197198 / MUCL 43194) TaxID=747089 RepID=U9TUT7_RHIID
MQMHNFQIETDRNIKQISRLDCKIKICCVTKNERKGSRVQELGEVAEILSLETDN